MTFDHADFQLLFDFITRIAKKLLDKQGTFLPFGAIVPPDGRKVALVSAETAEEQPGAQKVLELLEPTLRKMADKGTCRSIGLAIDTRLKAAPRKEAIGKDAIWIRLEHKDGTALMAATPYRKNWLGTFAYDETFAASTKPQFFKAGTTH